MNAQRSTFNTQHSTPRCMWLVVVACFCAVVARADISVSASVDRNRVAFGESLTFTITVQGTQSAAQPSIPSVDGLSFNGPSTERRFSMDGAATSQFVSFAYQVTPTRVGEFTIPEIEVSVGDKTYKTEPIKVTAQKGAPQEDLKDKLFGRVVFGAKEVYAGQVLPIQIQLFVRDGLPVSDVGLPQCDEEGLTYRFLANRKLAETVIDGVRFKVVLTDGAISFSRPGKVSLGSCSLKSILQFRSQARSLIEEVTGGHIENREVSVPVDAISIEVLPLPEEGKPADFTGAVGQWNLEVTAKPTELAVGDPITLTMRISGNGNIDTVATPQLQGLDGFKTYDPTSKTTKDELSTTGERVFQQVLVPKSTEARQLPQVRLSYFDPVAKTYKTAVQGPIQLVVKAGSGGSAAVLAAGTPVRPQEKLGRDIVYLKGDLGPVATIVWYDAAPTFWALNVLPIFSLLVLIAWKQRADRLQGDVAYARRTRAAKNARKMLAEANSFDQVQHALQSYLGDRLNIPISGITASIVDEQLVPRGLNGDLLRALKNCFEACDDARFAGVGNNEAEMRATANKVGELIDALEKIRL